MFSWWNVVYMNLIIVYVACVCPPLSDAFYFGGWEVGGGAVGACYGFVVLMCPFHTCCVCYYSAGAFMARGEVGVFGCVV